MGYLNPIKSNGPNILSPKTQAHSVYLKVGEEVCCCGCPPQIGLLFFALLQLSCILIFVPEIRPVIEIRSDFFPWVTEAQTIIYGGYVFLGLFSLAAVASKSISAIKTYVVSQLIWAAFELTLWVYVAIQLDNGDCNDNLIEAPTGVIFSIWVFSFSSIWIYSLGISYIHNL